MFISTYVILNNNKRIKIRNLVINDINIEFTVHPKYFGYFSSTDTMLKSGYFKGIFRKFGYFNFDQNISPSYSVNKNKVTVETNIEEL